MAKPELEEIARCDFRGSRDVCLGRITLPLYFKHHILIAPSEPESISDCNEQTGGQAPRLCSGL